MINAPFKNIEVLLVEDELSFASALKSDLATLGYAGSAAPNAETAMDMLAAKRFSILLTDIRLGKTDGLQLAERVRTNDGCIAIVFMTGNPDAKGLKTAQRLGAVQYISKPISFGDFAENMAIAARWNLAQMIAKGGTKYLAIRQPKSPAKQSDLQRVKVELKNIILRKRDFALLRDFIYSRHPEKTDIFHLLENSVGPYLVS